jgi:serine/threonine-protein kinase RsbW
MKDRNYSTRLTVPNDLAFLPLVTQYVAQVATLHGFTGEDTSKIEIATEEAVSNVIKHAFQPGEEATFDIFCELMPTGIRVIVADKGIPFDPEKVTPFTPGQTEAPGIGNFLMHQLMDSTEIRNLGKEGKEVRLTKYFSEPEIRTDPAKIGDMYNIEERSKEALSQAPAISFTMRRLHESEAIDVARLAYNTYGYSYISDHIYYPERIVALDKTNQIASCVAITDRGELGGYVALISFDDIPGVSELGAAMTDPKFRGQNILSELTVFTMNEAVKLGNKAVFAQATTAHPYSQKVLKKGKFTPISFMLAYTSPMQLKAIESASVDRHSVLVALKTLDKIEKRQVFLPEKHKDTISTIYNELNIEIEEGVENPIPHESIYTTTINTGVGMCKIVVEAPGLDIISKLKQEIVRVKREGLIICDLYLNMTQQGTRDFFDKIENLGFLFTGILPGSDLGDFAVLQYFNGIDVNFDIIQLADGYGQELIASIQDDFTRRFYT